MHGIVEIPFLTPVEVCLNTTLDAMLNAAIKENNSQEC